MIGYLIADCSHTQAPSNTVIPTVAVAPPPNYSAPHNFLVLVIVTAAICAILNPFSLIFGITAICFSAAVSSNGAINYNSCNHVYSLVYIRKLTYIHALHCMNCAFF